MPAKKTLMTETFTLGANMTAIDRFVTAANGVLAYPAGGADAVGVIDTLMDAGDATPVITDGIVYVEAGVGGITVDSLVSAAVAGDGTGVDTVAPAVPLGRALTGGVAGTKCLVKLRL